MIYIVKSRFICFLFYLSLINDIINFCPEKVIIHNKNNFETKEILNTVEYIFDKKTFYCTGCSLCKDEQAKWQS